MVKSSMHSNSGGEGEIRKNMIEAGLIDCMVALAAQLFCNIMIPASLWFLARNVLMPGRYVGTEAEEDEGISFDDKMKALTAKLAEQFARGSELKMTIRQNLKGIGYAF